MGDNPAHTLILKRFISSVDSTRTAAAAYYRLLNPSAMHHPSCHLGNTPNDLHNIHATGNNRSTNCSQVSYRIPIQEEARENIYDEPHTSTRCTSPERQLRDLQYYNYSTIMD